MNQSWKMLEFDKIIEMLKENAVTDKAKDNLDKLEPILKEKELRNRLKETSEARKLLDMQGAPPLGNVSNMRELVEGAERGELLTADELELVRQFAVQSMRLVRYLNKNEELDLTISSYGKGMADLEILKDEIERCIRNGKVDDYATKEIKEIRKKIEHVSNNIRLKLESILKSKKEYFSDYFVSNRNGHYTLPVKKEYKLMISGSVIDTSSSGATYFIEPSAAAKLREELHLLDIEESNEERKVLYMLSGNVVDFKAGILLNMEYMEELDFVFAKAKLSADMQAKEPQINTDRLVRIINGRHPLIKKEICVPLTIEFGGQTKGIVITGPNTGGKTVALKTVGLSSLMAQCGLHIPCEEAYICMNTQVLCDIGDGQSITENLSTFSAHIKNIIEIVNLADENSLILMDELGSGTDPTEGMGIAVSVLEELKKEKCNFIVTTHYPEIKEYAKQSETICNARMSFDKESLRPLYKLEMGKAGESCAFYIAKRLGMPASMLNRAYEAAYGRDTDEGENEKEEASIVKNKNMNYHGKKSFEENERSCYSNNRIPYDLTAHENVNSNVGHNKTAYTGDKKQIIKAPVPKQIDVETDKFQIGDSVMVFPDKKLGIVYKKADEKGQVGVQIQKQKMLINHKRLQLKAAAKDLYPEDYDFSIIFDSVENRKARHTMERKYVPGLEIKLDGDK